MNKYEVDMLLNMDYLWNSHNNPKNYNKTEMIKYLKGIYKAVDHKTLMQEIPLAIKMLKDKDFLSI